MKQPQIGLHALFVIFLKAGLAFGGGLGILAVLESEFVDRRALLATAAIQLPGYIMLPLVRLHRRFSHLGHVRHFIRSLTVTSVGLILAATIDIGTRTLTTGSGVVVFCMAFLLAFVLKRDPILSMVLASGAGVVLHYLL